MGWQLRTYIFLTNALSITAPLALRLRAFFGKEISDRWKEKLGSPQTSRPAGKVIWINAKGIGEVLAVRGLIEIMAQQDETTSFVITSTAISGAGVISKNLPARSIHQFPAIESAKYVKKFLANWKPNLSIWTENTFWPQGIIGASNAQIPLALVNGRLNDGSFQRRYRFRSIYADLLLRFRLIAVQDDDSARYFSQLGAVSPKVTGNIKAAAPSLSVDQEFLDRHSAQIAGRKVWLLASSWQADEDIALAAHAQMLQNDPTALLIIAPRDISRAGDIAAAAAQRGLQSVCKTAAPSIAPEVHVYIADSFGDMGLWYRLCRSALIGGSFGPTEGHNPWEAAVLGCAILYGPRTGNFTNDYAQLSAAQAAICVADASELCTALQDDHSDMTARAQGLTVAAKENLAPLAAQLLALMR
jgi:3-deoxy-D-manno-octulosonic-acid transferase